MKKWLKDRNLEPGPTQVLKNSSKAEMREAIVQFRKNIASSTIELSQEALNALSAFDDDTSDDDSDREESIASSHLPHLSSNENQESDRERSSRSIHDDSMYYLKTTSSDSTVLSNILRFDTNDNHQQNSTSLDNKSYLRSIDNKSPFPALRSDNGSSREVEVADVLYQLKKSPVPFSPPGNSIQVTVQQQSPYHSGQVTPQDTPQWKRARGGKCFHFFSQNTFQTLFRFFR
jgi:hypothetical protein